MFSLGHFTDGEDGSVQGLLKAMDLPLVGTGVLGSALSMNKVVAKRLLREAGLPVADYIPLHFSESKKPSFEDIQTNWDFFMVKSGEPGILCWCYQSESLTAFAAVNGSLPL